MKLKLYMLKSKFYGKKTYNIVLEPIDKIKKLKPKPSFYDVLQKPLKSNSFVRLSLKNHVFPVLVIEALYKPQSLEKLKQGNFLRGTLAKNPFLLAYDPANQFISRIPAHIIVGHLEQWLDCKGLRDHIETGTCKYLSMIDVQNLNHCNNLYNKLWF